MVMTWSPQYTITDKLLITIREIGEAIGEIKSFNLTGKALANLEIEASELSTYASTSIEGNPLPLTDVKRLLKTKKPHIRDTEREVINYNQALKKLYSEVRSESFKINITTLEKIQGQVVEGLMEKPTDSGLFRKICG